MELSKADWNIIFLGVSDLAETLYKQDQPEEGAKAMDLYHRVSEHMAKNGLFK